MKKQPLAKKVAVVAGGTRGTGRGIARALGEAGATVYVTGRSVRGAPSPYARPETIEETAEMVTAAGGTGTAVQVDHTDEAAVQALFARVQEEHGRLDVVVSSIGGEDRRLGGWTSFWETDLTHAAEVLHGSLLSHLITAKAAAPSMIQARRGLLVSVTEGDLLYGGGNVLHDLVKSGLKALAVRLSEELRKHRVAAVAITPGYLRSETMLEHYEVSEANWQEGAKKDPNFLASETPLFIGRAVAALAADRKVLARSGQILSSWELARDYGFTDADGTRPDWGRHFTEILPSPSLRSFQKSFARHAELLDQIARRAKQYAGEETP